MLIQHAVLRYPLLPGSYTSPLVELARAGSLPAYRYLLELYLGLQISANDTDPIYLGSLSLARMESQQSSPTDGTSNDDRPRATTNSELGLLSPVDAFARSSDHGDIIFQGYETADTDINISVFSSEAISIDTTTHRLPPATNNIPISTSVSPFHMSAPSGTPSTSLSNASKTACQYCQKEFPTVSNRGKHEREHCPLKPGIGFTCQRCGKKLGSYYRKDHEKKCSTTGVKHGGRIRKTRRA